LSRDLGRWVVDHACGVAGRWAHHTPVAVNVSPRQFSADGFAEHVLAALARTGLPASNLCLEITETAVLNASPSTLYSANDLVDHGVSLALDDFGTGQSSITALHRLPVRELKIDRSFVADVLVDPRTANLVHGLIQLGLGMDLDVIAEGIETEAQADWLTEHDCPTGQGYLFGRPEPIPVA
jgi:EAL domain-containing protein (putative c-di-GMP-specific phosphodiesterase class I)